MTGYYQKLVERLEESFGNVLGEAAIMELHEGLTDEEREGIKRCAQRVLKESETLLFFAKGMASIEKGTEVSK